MDQNTKRILLAWGLAMVIFFAIALVCIGFIFAPVENGNGELTVTYSSTSFAGMKLLAESWKRYPDYIIGLGTAAVLSFGGALYSIYNIIKVRETK